MAEPTEAQRKVIRAYIDDTMLPLIGSVLEKKLTQAALFLRDELNKPADGVDLPVAGVNPVEGKSSDAGVTLGGGHPGDHNGTKKWRVPGMVWMVAYGTSKEVRGMFDTPEQAHAFVASLEADTSPGVRVSDEAQLLEDLKRVASEAGDHTRESFARAVIQLANRAHKLTPGVQASDDKTKASPTLAPAPLPPQRPLVRLSDEQIRHLWDTRVGEPNAKYPITHFDAINFARAIEAALIGEPAFVDEHGRGYNEQAELIGEPESEAHSGHSSRAVPSELDTSALSWVPVTPETMPPSGKPVLASLLTKRGKRHTIRAHYAPKHTVDASHWDEGEPDETEDGCYEPEGWWEDPWVGERLEFVGECDGEVTHWADLPHPCNSAAGAQKPDETASAVPAPSRELLEKALISLEEWRVQQCNNADADLIAAISAYLEGDTK